MPHRHHAVRSLTEAPRLILLRLPLIFLLTAGACTSGNEVARRNPPDVRVGAGHPNVLILITDDQRAEGTLGVMPFTRRWFARGGTKFTRAYATTPLCCPSRASVFTGRYAHNHGVTSNLLGRKLDHGDTLQRLLRAEGYRTGIVGKFLNRWPVEKSPPHFDRFAIFTVTPKTRNYFGTTFNTDGELEIVEGYSTDFIGDRAKKFLDSFEAEDETPWFLVVATYAPHFPSEYPPRYASRPVPGWSPRPEVDLSDKPRYVRRSRQISPGRLRLMRRRQLRALMPVDETVAEVASLLNRLDEDDDTLAIFMSDNGFLWGEHGISEKVAPYEPAVRIPLLIRWASGRHPRRDERLAANIDIAPTIAQLTGIDSPATRAMDGRPLTSRVTRRHLLLEYRASNQYPVPSWRALITRTGQYTEIYDDTDKVIDREFYDFLSDPRQNRNLFAVSDRRPSSAKVERYKSLLRKYASCRGDECP
jgi:arylsulfatase A-like enzyme